MSDKPEAVPVDLLTEIDIQLSLEIGCASDKACLRRCKDRIAELEELLDLALNTRRATPEKEAQIRATVRAALQKGKK